MSYTYIDNTTRINGACSIASGKFSNVVIGKYCAIANNFKVITLNHDYNFPAVQGFFYKKMFNDKHPGEKQELLSFPTKERTKGDVIIGNDVWIGEDVFITSGVKIGDGCCIGARSVVTKNLPPYTICVGTPCKSIKNRYPKEVIDFLLEIKWWDWSEDKIRRNKTFFNMNLNQENIELIKNSII